MERPNCVLFQSDVFCLGLLYYLTMYVLIVFCCICLTSLLRSYMFLCYLEYLCCLIMCDISLVPAAPATTPLQCQSTRNTFVKPLLGRLCSTSNESNNVQNHVNGQPHN